jgi:hypothetical protein
MIRRTVLLTLFGLLLAAAPAHAAQVVVLRCTHGATPAERSVTFEGRIAAIARSRRMQMRFTLQAHTPDEPAWDRVAVPGFGTWITAPRGTRYLYDKRVEQLVAPGDYRAVVAFRWRDAQGRTVRREQATSRVCHQPDPRPDLAVVALRAGARYVAVVANRGRGVAGPFTVAFTRNGEPLGSVAVSGLASGTTTDAVLRGAPACSAGDQIAAQVDAGDAVDEVDEDGNVLTVTCS